MRQSPWLEFTKDNNFSIQYHPRKENVDADALSRRLVSTWASLWEEHGEYLPNFRAIGGV